MRQVRSLGAAEIPLRLPLSLVEDPRAVACAISAYGRPHTSRFVITFMERPGSLKSSHRTRDGRVVLMSPCVILGNLCGQTCLFSPFVLRQALEIAWVSLQLGDGRRLDVTRRATQGVAGHAVAHRGQMMEIRSLCLGYAAAIGQSQVCFEEQAA